MGEGGRGASNSCIHPSPNRHAIVGFCMRAIACIMFPSSHAAVGAYPRLDAVSSIIASSHSLIFLLLTSFSPESAVAASVSRSLSLFGLCFLLSRNNFLYSSHRFRSHHHVVSSLCASPQLPHLPAWQRMVHVKGGGKQLAVSKGLQGDKKMLNTLPRGYLNPSILGL